MPRLDNSTQDSVVRFGDLEKHNWDDPGENPPYDFCIDCWLSEVIRNDFDYLEIDHPDYEDFSYYCLICGVALMNDDNEY